ncbi:MAG: acyltransferase [Clostridia bacterium]|nr:acyltransferase [Clostridia bacterium]
MSLILFIDRIKNKIVRSYRKAVFRKSINCPHKSFVLVDKVHLINKNVKIGKNVTLYPDVCFFGDGIIEIGDNVEIGNNTVIYSSKDGGIKIGSNSMIAAQSYIIDTDHGIAAGELIRNQKNTVAPIEIGEGVWLAAGVKVLKGSKVKDGAVVGAQSLVKGEIPENAIAVGIPAKAIKYRS